MRDLDDQPSQEGPLPFWLKALAIVMLIPFINSLVPGSVVAIFILMGLPDPLEYREANTPPEIIYTAPPKYPALGPFNK